jgi:hypothetical protein
LGAALSGKAHGLSEEVVRPIELEAARRLGMAYGAWAEFTGHDDVRKSDRSGEVESEANDAEESGPDSRGKTGS